MRRLVATTKQLGEIIGELDVKKARRRDETLAEELATGATPTLRQKFIPDLAHGLIALDAGGAVWAGSGELFVQPSVTDDQGLVRRLDDVLGSGFAIVTSDDIAQTWLDESGGNLVGTFRHPGGRENRPAPGCLGMVSSRYRKRHAVPGLGRAVWQLRHHRPTRQIRVWRSDERTTACSHGRFHWRGGATLTLQRRRVRPRNRSLCRCRIGCWR